MKILKCNHFPPRGFKAINLFEVLVVRKGAVMRDWNYHHEIIHSAQMRELLYIFFYLWYGVEYLVRLIQYRNRKVAYKNVSFEREAYNKQTSYGYLDYRKHYSWIKYIRSYGKD